MAGSLPRRIAVAVVGIPTIFALVYLGGWPLTGALALIGAVGGVELFRLARMRGILPVAPWGLVGAAGAPVAVLLLARAAVPAGWIGFGAVVWFIGLMAAVLATRPPDAGPLASASVTLFGAAYAGLLPALLLLVRHGRVVTESLPATWLVFLPLAVTWICDTAAMAGGAIVGGPKLAPVVSPAKTWAGAASGTVAAVLAAPAYGALVLVPAGIDVGWWRLGLLGLVLSIVGQVGDLAESLFKREVGVKDSGRLLPGHGGVLDRFDSLYWVLPVAALFLSAYGAI